MNRQEKRRKQRASTCREFITHPLTFGCALMLHALFSLYPLHPILFAASPSIPLSPAFTLSSNGLSPVGGINKLLHPCVLRLSKDRLNINSSFASIVSVSHIHIFVITFPPFFSPFFLFVLVEWKCEMKLPYMNKSQTPSQTGGEHVRVPCWEMSALCWQ